MLGNNADAFFTKKMPTSIVKGNLRRVQADMMPAPFTSGSATKTVRVKAGSMLPGINGYKGQARQNSVAPFIGDDPTPATPVVAETQKFLGMSVGTLAIVGGLAFLFLTNPGAQLRAKIGL